MKNEFKWTSYKPESQECYISDFHSDVTHLGHGRRIWVPRTADPRTKGCSAWWSLTWCRALTSGNLSCAGSSLRYPVTVEVLCESLPFASWIHLLISSFEIVFIGWVKDMQSLVGTGSLVIESNSIFRSRYLVSLIISHISRPLCFM